MALHCKRTLINQLVTIGKGVKGAHSDIFKRVYNYVVADGSWRFYLRTVGEYCTIQRVWRLLLCRVCFPAHLTEVIFHSFTFFLWTQPVFTGTFDCLPGACLQLQYSGLVVLAEDKSRATWTNKQGDCCCLYS